MASTLLCRRADCCLGTNCPPFLWLINHYWLLWSPHSQRSPGNSCSTLQRNVSNSAKVKELFNLMFNLMCIRWSKPKRNLETLKRTERLVFSEEKRHFLSNIFLSASRVLYGGQKRIQCLPCKCPWRKVEASK